MPPLLDNARGLDVAGWIRGLLSAGISSAGGAIASGFGPAIVDPNDFNFQHPALIFKTAAVGATVAGVISMGKFLNSQPLPPFKEVTSTVQTITPAPGAPPKTIETLTEKHLEPMDKPDGQ
jgi:hypothetical protein